jgi:peptidoglycan-associated lipoprotein
LKICLQGFARYVSVAALALTLLACASPPPTPAPPPESYVVLLSDDDGGAGKVQLTTPSGTTLLDQNRQGSNLRGPAGQTYAVSQEKIDKDFAAALAATPIKPVSFLLYFEIGGAKLDAESERLLPRIFDAINVRAEADISIIGHTDTAGDDAANEKLGLERARFVAALIGTNSRIEASKVTIESHGEKNLLVPTPDSTSEARNRRVEVTVR